MADDVIRQNEQPTDDSDTAQKEPKRWLLHGKPGTGKTHTVKHSCKCFEEAAGFQAGAHYKVIALQATMAAQVEGDTIHHALHIRKGGFSQRAMLVPAKDYKSWKKK